MWIDEILLLVFSMTLIEYMSVFEVLRNFELYKLRLFLQFSVVDGVKWSFLMWNMYSMSQMGL